MAANLQRTIEIIFQATDDASPQVALLASNLESIGSAGRSIVGGLSSATDFILKLDAAIVGLGAAALAFAFSSAVDFEDALTDLQSVLREGQGSAGDFEGEITRLSEQFGIAAGDVARGAAQFVQANFSTSDSFTLLNASLTQTRLSNLSVAESSELLRKALTGFGAPVEDAAKFIDIFAQLNDNASVSVDQLAQAFATIAPTANQFGLSVEQTAAFLTPLIQRLGDGGAAAQLLGTGLLKLLDPSKEARETLDKLGISQRDANGEFLSGVPLLKNIQEGFSGLTGEQQIFLSSVLVGTKQAKEFNLVLGGGAEQQRLLELATNASGKSVGELAEKLALSQTAIDRFFVALENTSRGIGEQFRPQATGAIDATTELLQAFRDVVASGGLTPLFDLLRPLITSFTDSVRGIAKALPEAFAGLDFTGIVAAFKSLGADIGGLFEGIDLTTAAGLRKALQGIVDAGEALVRITGGIFESLSPVVRLLASGAGDATKFGQEFGGVIGNVLGVAKALDTFGPLLSGLTTTLGLVSSALTILWAAQSLAGASSLAGFATQITSFATALLTSGVGAIKGFGDALNGLDSVAGKATILVFVFELSRRITELALATETGRKAMLSLSDIITDAVDGISNTFSKLTGIGDVELGFSDLGAQLVAPTKALSALSTSAGAVRGELRSASTEIVSLGAVGRAAEADLKKLQQGFIGLGLNSDVDNTMLSISNNIRAISQGDFSPLLSEFSDLQQEADTTALATGKIVRVVEDGQVVFRAFGEAAKVGLTGVVEKTAAIVNQTDEFVLKLKEIDSQERVKVFEIRANVAIEALKADTAKFTSIIESLNTTIESTGDVIGSAFGALGDIGQSKSLFRFTEQMRVIEQQLEIENKLRTDAAEQQKELSQATIDEIRARTEAISRGDGLIRIDAVGLEPEIEAFMFKILQKIQVRAVEQNASFLLGVGA